MRAVLRGRRRWRWSALLAAGGILLAVTWFWGLHPARGLARNEVVDVYMATNRLQQSLWQTGYDPNDCAAMPPADHKYTCMLIGPAREQVRGAVAGPSRSFYVLGREPVPDPVHILSFKTAGGVYYLVAVRSLEEADAGVFYGYRAPGEPIVSDEIRWFRYTNVELGRVLREMRHTAP